LTVAAAGLGQGLLDRAAVHMARAGDQVAAVGEGDVLGVVGRRGGDSLLFALLALLAVALLVLTGGQSLTLPAGLLLLRLGGLLGDARDVVERIGMAVADVEPVGSPLRQRVRVDRHLIVDEGVIRD